MLNHKVQNELIAGESVVTIANPSKWLLVPSAVGCVLLMIAAVALAVLSAGSLSLVALLVALLGVMKLVAQWVYIVTTQLVVTDKRVIVKKGWLFISTDEIKVQKVESVEANQSLTERMFKIGTVKVNGTGSNHLGLRGVPSPRQLKNIITEQGV